MHRQNGFTLLEILIAVMITSMLSLGVWQLMSTLLASRDGIERVSDQFREVQRTMLMLERDLFQAISRPVEDGFGDPMPALTSRNQDSAFELTRQGWRNPLGKPRSTLQRVAWEYDGVNKQVIRRFWEVLDRAQDTEAREQRLMSNVENMAVRFLDDSDNWSEQWPADTASPNRDAPRASSRDTLPLESMPRAVEVTLEHQRFGTLRRVVDLPGTPTPLGDTADQPGDAGGLPAEVPQ